MKIAKIGARILLGLIYTVFSLNFFLHFLPNPEMNAKAGAFIGALIGTGYVFTLVKIVEFTGGILVLSGYFTSFGLVILAPITINIFLFHTMLAPENGGFVVPSIMVALHLFLAFTTYKKNYAGVFSIKEIE
jgi:uncharacterized membrane protein YphA (DoxX/SURF4 family)